MVSEIRTAQVVIPAGTPISAPVTIDVSFPPRTVTAVYWKVPPGPSGLMGWALTVAGNPVIPLVHGTYIVADNESQTWQLEDYPDQGSWQVTGYNTDIYAHTVYLTFLLDQNVAQIAIPAPISNTDLSSPPPLALAPAPDLITVPAVSA